jgi:hypothetical protein
MDKSSAVWRAYRQLVGRYRVCYESALSRKSRTATSDAHRVLNGYWAARAVHGARGAVCSVEVVHTTLPDEMSSCLRGVVLELPPIGGESGKVEFVITFYEP